MTNAKDQSTSTGTFRNTQGDTTEKSTVDEAKEQAQELSNKAQQKAGEATEKVKQGAANLTEEAKQQANQYAQEAKETARTAAEERKDNAATRLEGVASGLREAGRKFQDEDEEIFARYADSAASGVEDFSNYLRTHSTGDLLHEVERFAHRQPEVFLAGALAAGFFLGRFFKSSGRRSHGQQNWRGDSPYAQQDSFGYNRSQQGYAQHRSYREQTPDTADYGSETGRNRFYQDRQDPNRPYGTTQYQQPAYGDVPVADRVDRSSAVGSTSTVSRTWDATDVDTMESHIPSSTQSSKSTEGSGDHSEQKDDNKKDKV